MLSESGSVPVWRRRAALLLLWALLPLPFLYIILPPFWMLGALVCLWRVLDADRRWSPSNALLNVLAVVSLLLVVAAGGLRIGPLRPLGHLLILLSTLKMVQVDGREDFRRLLAPLFLVQLIGIVSAVHISVLLYLLLSTIWWWSIGMSVLMGGTSSELEKQGMEAFSGQGISCLHWKHVLPAAGLAMIFAIPVFLLFPRINSPFLALEGEGREAGFSTSVELDRSGSILESSEPVMLVDTVDGRPVREEWLRLRATAYREVFSGFWRAPEVDPARVEARVGLIRLSSKTDLSGTVELVLTPLRAEEYLFLPSGTVAVSSREEILVDESGGLRRADASLSPEAYHVFLRDPPSNPEFRGPGPGDLIASGASRRMRQLAATLESRGRNSQERAFAVEAELLRRCRYSLSIRGVSKGNPVDWFLFEGKRGHCEFFAAAMVQLLRLEKIPARFVAGYHGGSLGGRASRVTIRSSNAHAWVEAWLGPEKGWRVFDPTPPEGVDRLEKLSWWRRLKNSWTKVEDFYDRNILSFGMREQFRLLKLGAGLVSGFRGGVKIFLPWIAVVLLLSVSAFLFLGRRHFVRRRWGPARRVLHRLDLRMRKEVRGDEEELSWGQLGIRAAGHWPQAAVEILSLTRLAEEEAYSEGHRIERRELAQIWKKIRSKIRRGAL